MKAVLLEIHWFNIAIKAIRIENSIHKVVRLSFFIVEYECFIRALNLRAFYGHTFHWARFLWACFLLVSILWAH